MAWTKWRGLLAALVACLAFCGASRPAQAEVKLPAIIGENMALQQGVKVPLWGTAAPGEEVTVTFLDQKVSAKADAEGKWKVILEPLKAGGPHPLTIAGQNTISFKNVVVGEVWLGSGQSNMEWVVWNSNNRDEEIRTADFPSIRLFKINNTRAEKPASDVKGQWVVCAPGTVGGFSAVLYFFGRDIHRELKVPVGLIFSAWGGTPIEAWTPEPAMRQALPVVFERFEKWTANYPEKKAKYDEALKAWNELAAKAKAENKPQPQNRPQPPMGPDSPHRPACLYNANIAPLQSFPIAGMLWYQGEANVGRPDEYVTLLSLLIKEWRAGWGQGDIPFLVVQLANHMARRPDPSDSFWAMLRESQARVVYSLPRCGLAVAIDIGDEKDIHPRNKQDVGKRLALAAKAIAYGKDIPYSGPVFDGATPEGGKLRVRFKHANGGLVAKDGPLTGFAIAGKDRKYVWADAVIDGETVVLSSAKVPEPLSVRYAWADNPACNLYNGAGLPAVPFRSDGPEKK